MPNFHLVFADWRARPGRDQAWRDERRENFVDESQWKREYPERLEDVLLSSEEIVFSQWAIEQCTQSFVYPVQPIHGDPRHRYVTMWDEGRKNDAAVGITLDVTANPYILVNYRRYVGKPFNFLQLEIEEEQRTYKSVTYVGDDNVALAITENLKVPATHFLGTTSTKSSGLGALKIALERGWLAIPESCTQLLFELSSYMWDDDGITQDSVMALANLLYTVGPPLYARTGPTLATTRSRADGLRASTSVNTAPKGQSRLTPLATGRSAGRAGRRPSGSGQSSDADYMR